MDWIRTYCIVYEKVFRDEMRPISRCAWVRKAIGCRKIGGILSFFWKKMPSDATSFEGAPDTCRDMRGRSLYRMQKVGKKLAGSGNEAYLCTIKNTITTKKTLPL